MKLRTIFKKIYDAVEGPPHVQGQGGGGDSLLDAKVTARGVGSSSSAGPGTAPAPAPTNWVPSQQDERDA